MNNNVYLKRVRKTYKKHERNTKGKIGVKKWPKVDKDKKKRKT